ncbi:MAG: T9SS type A sorting domain-containing protein [Ignavibacteria bacterium]|nr:T9SS type A sorting domain-containing protein [Ignavibacteria bacterium]
MKVINFILFFACTLCASAQWEAVFIPEQGTDLHDVHLISGEHGVAVGKLGTILMTDDGFHTWKRITSGTSQDFYALNYFDATTAVAAGIGGMILRTTDGGNTWSAIISGTSDSLYKFSSLSPTTAIVVGSNGTILKTIDKGLHWSSVLSGTTMSLLSISSNGTTCIATGKNGIILRSPDAGDSWEIIPSGTELDLYTVSWVTNSTLLIGGDSCAIYRSTDTGKSWQFDQKLFIMPDKWTSAEILDIQFVNDSVGYMCGRLGSTGSFSSFMDYARIHYTKDAGKTWQRLIGSGYDPVFKDYDGRYTNSGKGYWRRMSLINPDSVIVVGFNEYNSTGIRIPGSSVIIAGGPNSPLFEMRLNSEKTDSLGYVTATLKSFTSVYSTSPSVWKVATNKGEVFQTTDAGKKWSREIDSIGGYCYDMKFTGDFGIMTADSGRIYSTQDGGISWKRSYFDKGIIKLLVYPVISDVTILNATTAICLEQYGYRKLIRTDNAGETWTKINLDIDSISSITVPTFTDEKHGWLLEQPFTYDPKTGRAVNLKQGRLHFSSNGGVTWVDKTPYSIIESRDKFWNQRIDFSDTLHGWFTAFEHDSTTILKNRTPIVFSTNDGGDTWKRTVIDMQPFLPSNPEIYSLQFMDVMGIDSMNYILYLSYEFNNKVIRTTDGGTTWKEMTYNNDPLTSNKNRAFYRADSTTFFMFGDNSMLYRWKYTKEVTGVDELIDVPTNGITISPNPTSTSFTISGIDNISSVKIMNSLGIMVNGQWLMVNGQISVDVSGLAAGVYFVQVQTATGIVTKPVVITR